MRDKPGFEHLNEPLHVLIEAELPANIIEQRLIHAREILQELLKPVVSPSRILSTTEERIHFTEKNLKLSSW